VKFAKVRHRYGGVVFTDIAVLKRGAQRRWWSLPDKNFGAWGKSFWVHDLKIQCGWPFGIALAQSILLENSMNPGQSKFFYWTYFYTHQYQKLNHGKLIKIDKLIHKY